MSENLSVTLIEDGGDLLDIVQLKQADDSECLGELISEDSALQKLIRIRDNGNDFWIARHKSKPVGYAIGIKKDQYYRFNGIYVDPEYRRKGIGQELIQAQINFAGGLDCKGILSNVSGDNSDGIGLLEKANFKFEPNVGGYIVSLELK